MMQVCSLFKRNRQSIMCWEFNYNVINCSSLFNIKGENKMGSQVLTSGCIAGCFGTICIGYC